MLKTDSATVHKHREWIDDVGNLDKKVWTVCPYSGKFSANTKKHSFVAKLAKCLLTECLQSCNKSRVF